MNVDEFLGFLFPGVNDPDGTEVVAIGGDRKDNTDWTARRWRPGELEEPVGRLYFCISTVKRPANPRANRVTKGAADLVLTYVIGLDDIGTKFEPPAVPPTDILETSPGNFQWLYKLSYPVAPAEAHALIEALADAGYTDPGAKRADRYLRVPGSLNVKRDPVFVCRHVEHHPERQLSLTQLTMAFNVLPRGHNAPPGEMVGLKQGEVDPTWDLILAQPGFVKGQADGRGWVPVLCINEDEHTPGRGADGGTHYFPMAGGGIYKCLHGHCTHIDTPTLRDWLFEQEMPDLAGFGQELEAALDAAADNPQIDSVPFAPVPPAETRAQVRRSVIGDLIHVATEDKYWSIEVSALLPLRAIDHRLYRRMVVVGLLDGTTPTGRETIWPPQTWLKNQPDVRRVGKVVHRLGQPLVIDNCLNIAPPLPRPVTVEGDPEMWLDLVDFVCTVDEDADLVLDWMALMVTAWDEKPGWHLLLKGAHGTGKNLLLSPLKWYTAPDHWYGLTVKDVEGVFTPFLARRFITLDELQMTTRGQLSTHDIYNSVKAWTARGTGFQMINEKNMKPYAALDLSGWGVTSNAQVPLPLEVGDRRWLVIETPRVPESEAYYKRLVDWLEAGGNAIVVGWLQRRWAAMSRERREIVRGTAPMTAAKRELIQNSAEGIEGAVRLSIAGIYGDSWPDLMKVDDVMDRLTDSHLLSVQAKRNLTVKRVAMALQAADAVQLFGGKPVENSAIRRTMRLWCLRPDKAKDYEKLGQGKALVDEYDRQRSGGTSPPSGNIVKFRP